MFLGEGDIMSNFSLMTQNIILPEYIQNGTAPFSTLTIAEKYKHWEPTRMKTTGYMKEQHTPGLVDDDDEDAFVLVTHSPPRHHFPVSSYLNIFQKNLRFQDFQR